MDYVVEGKGRVISSVGVSKTVLSIQHRPGINFACRELKVLYQ